MVKAKSTKINSNSTHQVEKKKKVENSALNGTSCSNPTIGNDPNLNSVKKKHSKAKLMKWKANKKRAKVEKKKNQGKHVSVPNPTADIQKKTILNEASSAQPLKKKSRFSSALVSGSSNWANLCSKELNSDPFIRKRRIEKVEEEAPSNDTENKVPKQDIWFDDIDDMLLEKPQDTQSDEPKDSSSKSLVKDHTFTGPTKYLGMDCEMVGVGKEGEESVLARVSLVNVYGHCIYDKYVIPRETVTDYRTFVSGVTKKLIQQKGEPFSKVQKEVSDFLRGKVLVGHALENDLKVLFLSHPHKDVRDTSLYKPFRELFKSKPSLKKLTSKLLGVTVQEGEHSSIQDAQAAMRLYTMHRKKWEKSRKELHRHKRKISNKKKKTKTKQ